MSVLQQLQCDGCEKKSAIYGAETPVVPEGWKVLSITPHDCAAVLTVLCGQCWITKIIGDIVTLYPMPQV